MEGDFCVIGRGILSTEDLDVPQDMLSFSIASPPGYGLLLNGIYGRDLSWYKSLNSAVLHQDLQIHSFSLAELKQGLSNGTLASLHWALLSVHVHCIRATWIIFDCTRTICSSGLVVLTRYYEAWLNYSHSCGLFRRNVALCS